MAQLLSRTLRHLSAREGASGSADRTESTSRAACSERDVLLHGPARGPRVGNGDVMTTLPANPNLEQLRRQAKELLRAAKTGEPDAVRRVEATSVRLSLAAAQLAVAREYGFTSWSRLKDAVEARTLE